MDVSQAWLYRREFVQLVSAGAKAIVRTTMKTLLEGGAGPLPGWPKNGSRIWSEWNNCYQRIWKGTLKAAEIQTELDALQKSIEGLVTKTG